MDEFNNSNDFSQKNPTLQRIADDVVWKNYEIKDTNDVNDQDDSKKNTDLKNAHKNGNTFDNNKH